MPCIVTNFLIEIADPYRSLLCHPVVLLNWNVASEQDTRAIGIQSRRQLQGPSCGWMDGNWDLGLFLLLWGTSYHATQDSCSDNGRSLVCWMALLHSVP